MFWENKVGKARWLMYHLEKDDVTKLKAKWDQIGASLDKSSNAYSGTYYLGDWMSGYFLRWSSSGGYVFVRFFDVEHPCYFSFGDVAVNDNTITFVKRDEASGSRCPPIKNEITPKEWIPAMGGKYLIPKNEARQFADFYGGFGDYNGYLRTYESSVPFAFHWARENKNFEKFVLLGDFAKFVKDPINAKIISVGKTRIRKPKYFPFTSKFETVTPVTINVGTNVGLRKLQEFVLLNNDDGRSETLAVKSVGKKHSRAIVVRTVLDNGKEGYLQYNYKTNELEDKPFTRLKIGTAISTSPETKL